MALVESQKPTVLLSLHLLESLPLPPQEARIGKDKKSGNGA